MFNPFLFFIKKIIVHLKAKSDFVLIHHLEDNYIKFYLAYQLNYTFVIPLLDRFMFNIVSCVNTYANIHFICYNRAATIYHIQTVFKLYTISKTNVSCSFHICCFDSFSIFVIQLDMKFCSRYIGVCKCTKQTIYFKINVCEHCEQCFFYTVYIYKVLMNLIFIFT